MKPTAHDIARMIDHSLLHPTMTAAQVREGCAVAARHEVATACVKPLHTALAAGILRGSPTAVCAVIGFPHGNSLTEIKVRETECALRDGAVEIDMVAHPGQTLGGEWDALAADIGAVQAVCAAAGAKLKVIFENDYLDNGHIERLCGICTAAGVAFVKTSTGYGFVKQPGGGYDYKGATLEHLRLMRRHAGPAVELKAAGGVRTLDDTLLVRALGVTRIGATATVAIVEEARRREAAGTLVLPDPAGATALGGGY